MPETYFPANVEQLKGSQDYTELKKRIVELDRKLDSWLSNFDSRLNRLESKPGSGIRKAGTNATSVPKKMAPKKA